MIAAIAALVLLSGTYSEEQLPGPPGTPPPPTADLRPTPTQYLVSRPGIDELDPGSFPLYEPIPHAIERELGGRTFTIPKGDTLVEGIGDVPVIVGGTPLTAEHLNFYRIERGETYAMVDGETGEIFDSYIAPEDEADFADFQ